MVNLIPPPEMADRKTFDWLYQLYEWLSVRLGGGEAVSGYEAQSREGQQKAFKSMAVSGDYVQKNGFTAAVRDAICPVGGLYATTGDADPADLLGGTWSLVAEDVRLMLGESSAIISRVNTVSDGQRNAFVGSTGRDGISFGPVMSLWQRLT